MAAIEQARGWRAPPRQPGLLFGRKAELTAGTEAMLDRDLRLLTLTGPGGTGKTRLAVALAEAVAERFGHRVCFVDLTPLNDAGLVLSAIADALAVREPTSTELLARVIEVVDAAPSLLVLDNFEHVLDAAPVVSEMLAGAPTLTVLATSRERLRLRWEHVREVPLLAVCGAPDNAGESAPSGPAVALFVDRARAAKPDFRMDPTSAKLVTALCVGGLARCARPPSKPRPGHEMEL